MSETKSQNLSEETTKNQRLDKIFWFKVLVKYLAQVKDNIQQSKNKGILTFIPSVKISP